VSKFRKVFAAVALITALCGCSDRITFQPNAQLLIVEAVIDASARHQDIFVQQTDGVVRDQHYVTDAAVSISAPDGNVLTARAAADTTSVEGVPFKIVRTFYRVSLDEFHHRIVPGGQYRLDVKVPGRPDVSGTTIIPTAVETPYDSTVRAFRILHDTLAFAWPASAHTKAHQVVVRCAGQYRHAIFGERSLLLPGLKSFDNDGVSGTFLFSPDAVCDVGVVAVDVNYYNYYRVVSSSPGQPIATGQLKGAVGVFGAITRVSRQRFFVTFQ
jgi:hypothetical protein